MKKLITLALLIGLLGGCSDSYKLITVGKENISKDELFGKLLTSSNKQIIEREIHDKLLFQEINVSEDEIKKELEEMKQTFQSDSIKKLQKTLEINEKELYVFAKRRVAESKLLIKKAKIDEEFSEKESGSPDIYANYMKFDDRNSAELVLNLIADGSTFESAVQSLNENYYLTYKWNEKTDDKFYEDLIKVKLNDISPIIKIENHYWIFEVVKNPLNIYVSNYDKVVSIATQRGISLFDVYTDLEKKYEIKIQNEKIAEIVKIK